MIRFIKLCIINSVLALLGLFTLLIVTPIALVAAFTLIVNNVLHMGVTKVLRKLERAKRNL